MCGWQKLTFYVNWEKADFIKTCSRMQYIFLIKNYNWRKGVQFISVTQSCPILQPHGLQHTRLPCPLPTPGVYSNSCPTS